MLLLTFHQPTLCRRMPDHNLQFIQICRHMCQQGMIQEHVVLGHRILVTPARFPQSTQLVFISLFGNAPTQSRATFNSRVRLGNIFFLTMCRKNYPSRTLGHLFSPNFGIFKVQGGCPMEKYSATLGLQPKKNVEFLGAELGTLSRDVCPHGPKIDSGYFWCTMYTWGLCPFLGTEFFPKKTWPPKNYPG